MIVYFKYSNVLKLKRVNVNIDLYKITNNNQVKYFLILFLVILYS